MFLALLLSFFPKGAVIEGIRLITVVVSFFVPEDNLLLSMIANDRQHVPELIYRRVLKFKTYLTKAKSIQNYLVLAISFNISDYYDIKNRSDNEITYI